jgi:hypothetical protein
MIPEVLKAAVGQLDNDELLFTFPEVLNVIRLCTTRGIAVLGAELFLVKPEGYYASGCSTYDLDEMRRWPVVQSANWPEYVKENNELAEIFIRRNPLGDDHVYILTNSSWSEFCRIQKTKR